MRMHGPSLAVGGGVAAVAAVAVIAAYAGSAEKELELVRPEGGAATLEALTRGGSAALGSDSAPVTIVEFGDYQCHFCNRFYHDTEPGIVRDYIDTGKARLVFKDFTIIGPDSVSAANAAHCAGDQGRFWEYHDVLYDNWAGENNGWASGPNLEAFAAYAGLDLPEWSECVSERRHAERVSSNRADAEALGLTGTPAFFVVGPSGDPVEIRGAQPYSVFARAIDEAA